jgi:hypothetical protein
LEAEGSNFYPMLTGSVCIVSKIRAKMSTLHAVAPIPAFHCPCNSGPCRKLTRGYIGGAARPRWAQPTSDLRPARRGGPVRPSVVISACAPRCTTRQHNAHRTEEREVLYPWHPWFGRVVFVHETTKRGGAGALRCSQSSEEGARCLETPEWMFDRAACCGMVRGDSPRVSRAALYRLKALISGGFGGSSGGVIEARSYSLPYKGEADAPSGSRSCPAARSVSSNQSASGLVATSSGNARKGSAPDHVPATRAKERAGSRPRGERAER